MKKAVFLLVVFILFSIFTNSVFANEYNVYTVYTEWSPKSAIVSPDGSNVYVLNLESCSVTVYDTKTRDLIKTIYFPQTYGEGWNYETETPIDSIAQKPVEGAFSGDGRYLWVSFHNDSAVVVYDTTGKGFEPSLHPSTIEATIKHSDGSVTYQSLLRIPVGKTPKIITVSPDEKTVAVSNWHGLSVSIIDAETFKVIKTIPVSEVPRGMVFTPDGKLLYVAIMYETYLEIIDTSTWKITGMVPDTGPAPRDLSIDAKGKYIYCSVNQDYTVVKIDTSTNKVVDSLPVGNRPRTIRFSPDETLLYVCCYGSNKLYIIDVETFTITGSIQTGENPVGADVTPKGTIWITNQGDGTVTVIEFIK